MAATPHPWSILTIIIVLVVQLCIAEKSCTIHSTAGPLVQRGSSFKVYCTFICKCTRPTIYSMDDTPPPYIENNSTTLHVNVVNITNDRTYSCQCNSCGHTLDPCGLDIYTGYPPDTPENINCTQEVTNGEAGVVMCTWNRGRDTYLKDTSNLWVRTTSGNYTNGPKFYAGSTKGSDRLSANFIVSSSVQVISVWVNTSNKLGSAESTTLNFILSDIVIPSPPVLAQAECSSRGCNIQVTQAQKTQHMEIQYKTEQQAWMTYRYPHFGRQTGPMYVQSISSLEPYHWYYFRARIKFSTGLWSQWSASISNRTQEEAPGKELDVWFSGLSSKSEPITVHWKKLNDSDARGKIVEYRLKVRDIRTRKISTKSISVADNHTSVHPCALCEVTVFARNSKGLSPPAIVPILRTTVQPPQDVRHVALSNHSVSITWREPETTSLHTGYLVEWYPVGRQVEELQWLRLGPNEKNVIIADNFEPFECYEGAVYVFYEKSLGRAGFERVSTWESAPQGSPSVQPPDQPILGDRVTVTWMEVPREQRGGCIIKFCIYIKNIKNDKNISVPYHCIPVTETKYIIEDLSPAQYILWMTAWTAKGEGPAGPTVQIFITTKQESPVVAQVTCVLIVLIFLVVLCLCQISAIQQRFYMFFHILMPDVIPDPANSKWARECAEEKGKMSLQLHLSDSSWSGEDDEPITVEVQELHESSCTSTPDASSHFLLQPSLSPVTNPVTCLYPQISYIKSFSHESDSSYHTHSSQDTNKTVDYISTHGPGNGIEEEDEFEEECMGVLSFVPTHDVFMDPPVFSGKLTLDAVKIDCSDFLWDQLVEPVTW